MKIYGLFDFVASFLVIFISLIAFFSTIHGFHCTIQLTFNFFFSTLSTKKFHFQLNKLFSNGPELLFYLPFLTKKKKRKFPARIE